MSTRYMKKFFGSDGIFEKGNENFSDIEVSTSGNFESKAFNVFDVLNYNSTSENEVIDDEHNTLSKDVKRKKKKKKHKKSDNQMSADRQAHQQYKYECDEKIDEIEKSLREVNKILGEPIAGSSENTQSLQWVSERSKESSLTVQHKHLNPYNELKRIFGSKTIQAEQSKKRNRVRIGHLRRTWLVSAREHWPPMIKSGLSMSVDGSIKSTGHIQYFTYDHDSSYKQVQTKFSQAVESSNPDSLVTIINANPYHVDTSLQLAELCKISEDLQMAAEFTERALYSLEYAFHPLFNVTTAHCRLDYKKQQNRALFITLFKHLNFVGGRACYRTSLEFCKLLLSLDPENDPLAVVLALDFYALRAKEYEWFVEFCNLWDSTRNLVQLPNIAYGLALAHFYLSNQTKADELLQNALIMFPGVLIPLIDKCNVQSDVKVISHDFFNGKAKTTTPIALEKLQILYIARSFHLWKESDVLQWLEKCVHAVLNRVESGDSYVKYCQLKRGKRYQSNLPTNVLRHIILTDIKEITVSFQEIQDAAPILSHDPLPPADSIDIYGRPAANIRTHQNSSNLFSLFFSSLFTDIEGDVAAAAINDLNLFDDNDERA